MHGARATLSARAMHVEKHRTITLAQGSSIQSIDGTANRVEHTSRHMTRDDRIWDAGQAAVPEVNIGAAYLRARSAEEGRARRQVRTRKLSDLNRLPGRRHHRCQDW